MGTVPVEQYPSGYKTGNAGPYSLGDPDSAAASLTVCRLVTARRESGNRGGLVLPAWVLTVDIPRISVTSPPGMPCLRLVAAAATPRRPLDDALTRAAGAQVR